MRLELNPLTGTAIFYDFAPESIGAEKIEDAIETRLQLQALRQELENLNLGGIYELEISSGPEPQI